MHHLPPKPAKPKKIVAVNRDTPIPATPPIELRFDGACAPNPGPMGIGYLLITGVAAGAPSGGRRVLVRVGAGIGQGTNNEAEYQALISGLRHALRLGMLDLDVKSDSALVVNQVMGKWKAKDKRLARLLAEVHALLPLFNTYKCEHVYREENTEADALSHTVTFEEPDLGVIPSPKPGAAPRQLHEWQAALIRLWWLKGKTHNPNLLGRVFGVNPVVIEQIVEGTTYRMATLNFMPKYLAHHLPYELVQGEAVCPVCQGRGYDTESTDPHYPPQCKPCMGLGWVPEARAVGNLTAHTVAYNSGTPESQPSCPSCGFFPLEREDHRSYCGKCGWAGGRDDSNEG